MPFIELTRYPNGRMLINTDNISSIYTLERRDGQSANWVDVTVIQEITSVDNYWEVVESIDEIVSLLNMSRTQEPNLTDRRREVRNDRHI